MPNHKFEVGDVVKQVHEAQETSFDLPAHEYPELVIKSIHPRTNDISFHRVIHEKWDDEPCYSPYRFELVRKADTPKFKRGDIVYEAVPCVSPSSGSSYPVSKFPALVVEECQNGHDPLVRFVGYDTMAYASRFEKCASPVSTAALARKMDEDIFNMTRVADVVRHNPPDYPDAKPGAFQVSPGPKFDAGKLLFTPLYNGLAAPLRAIAAVLSYGAQKYAEDSWKEVPSGKKRYENALYRHQNARASGEIYDAESGLPHRAHEICNSLFILWFEIQDKTITNIDKYNQPPEKPNV